MITQNQKIIGEKKLRKLQDFYKGRGSDIDDLASVSGLSRSTLYSHLREPKSKDVIKVLIDFRLRLIEKEEKERKALEAKI